MFPELVAPPREDGTPDADQGHPERSDRSNREEDGESGLAATMLCHADSRVREKHTGQQAQDDPGSESHVAHATPSGSALRWASVRECHPTGALSGRW